MIERRSQDAWHEAAHAVVGCYLGLRCHGVVLSCSKTLDGWAAFLNPATKRLAFGTMLAAGPAGDKLRGWKDPYGWSGDLGMLRDHGFFKNEVRMLEDLATHYLVTKLGAKWKRVADVLHTRNLDGPEVRSYVLFDEPLED